MPSGARTAPASTLFKQLAALAVGAVVLLASAAAWADPPGRVGRIADTAGTVWMFDAEQGEWIAAQRNRPLTSGDRLSAERDALAELQIGSATLWLDGGSELEVMEIDDHQVRLHLHHGSLALRLRSSASAREFSVTTAEGRFDPLRAGHYRIDQLDNFSFGGVIAGALRFEARDSALELVAGQRAEFWNDRGVTNYSWAALPNDRFAEWSAQQDRQGERDARRRPYVSPEMTGAEDLDRYGDWDQHPEYGALWYPRGVDAGWAPYRYGYWAYVRPWGYTWVDNAPWGFAPFHYGRWISWQGRWAWAPGQYVARPVYAPALVAWIGGPNISIGINIGGGPSVGWVPLSPREVYRPTYSVTNIYVTNVNSPHRRWHPQPNQPVRTGPIMYTNQGVPGGVTVVSQQVLRERQPISNAVIAPVDPQVIQKWQSRPQPADTVGLARQAYVPPAPPARAPRVVATPGAAVPAVPAAPGTVRTTPWGQVTAPPRGVTQPPAVQTDSSQPPRGRPPQADARAGDAPRSVSSAPPAAAAQRDGPQRPSRDLDSGRGDARRGLPQGGPPVQPVSPTQPVPVGRPVPGVRVVPQAPPGPPAAQQPGAPVVQQPVAPARGEPGAHSRGPKDAEERDERKPTGQERRREQQNQ